MNYDFHPEARLEYSEAAVFYEARRSGLGAAFTLEAEAAIHRILEAPERWRVIEQDVRRCLTHTFPYGILYTFGAGSHIDCCGDALTQKTPLDDFIEKESDENDTLSNCGAGAG